jgi:hypothetical protein
MTIPADAVAPLPETSVPGGRLKCGATSPGRPSLGTPSEGAS